MAAPGAITPTQLARLIGTPETPLVVDVRTEEDHARDPRLIPASLRRSHTDLGAWANKYSDRRITVVCRHGLDHGQGVAAWLRNAGAIAEYLEGGFESWVAGNGLLLRPERVPPRDQAGRTVWVTRARPKIDRVACPWLIRRFVDPDAVFLFVAPAEVQAAADRFGATPFDTEDTFWSHRGEHCTFDVMLEEFGLRSAALERLATIVRGADTDRLDIAPQAAGLLAASLGLSRIYREDLQQLAASMGLYDAFYRWARDAVGESHDWPAPLAARRPVAQEANR